jgi:hypothetical protein
LNIPAPACGSIIAMLPGRGAGDGTAAPRLGRIAGDGCTRTRFAGRTEEEVKKRDPGRLTTGNPPGMITA